MNLPIHLFRLQSSSAERQHETVQIATRADVLSIKPLFRAPALPTPNQLSRELPFTVNYRPRLRERS